ncbi:hypothetical protein HYDPIDRAFT_171398 [Hydnomerulius pinastri MD-312]|uniref:Uncharacterized protein n=1 Tax=Hydnomerulius pinastri MD-312 TaxID=994086 RepID=A0A0C9VXT6_9AGAM|nr:hypothetical protein HYDPIDRAFT_171398 [Hydnomerulius pinastri MD-312]
MVILLPALFEMEQQIQALGVPKRSLTQQDLFKTFSIKDKGNKANATATAIETVEEEDEEDEEEDADEEEERKKRQQRRLGPLSLEVDMIVNAMKTSGRSRAKAKQGSSSTARNVDVNVRPDFMDKWVRVCKLPQGSQKTIRVAQLLNAMTFNWATEDSHSAKRVNRTVACMSIQEHGIIRAFRTRLLDDTYGAGAHIRAVLERRHSLELKYGQGAKEMPKLDVDGKTKGKVKARSVQSDRRGEPMRLFSWPDGLKFDSVRAASMSFTAYDPNNKYRKKVIMDNQTRAVQATVNIIQRLGCAFLDAQFAYPTKYSGRLNERNRTIELTLDQIRQIDRTMRSHWDRWVRDAPASWKEDAFLQENLPVAITKRYRHNQKIMVTQANDMEMNNWNIDHDFSNLRTVAFSVASHLQYIKAEGWNNLNTAELIRRNPHLYSGPDNDPDRAEIEDLNTFPLLNDDGREVPIYDAEGYRVRRRFPNLVAGREHGALVDLRRVSTLFPSEGHRATFDPYPLAYTKVFGNAQARRTIEPYDEVLRGLNLVLTPPARPAVAEDDGSDHDEQVDFVRGSPVIRGTFSQMYNQISHRVRDQARFHSVQLGLTTTTLTGTSATSRRNKDHFEWLRRHTLEGLPQERFNDKVAKGIQAESLRIEQSFVVDVHRLAPRHKNGTTLYNEILKPLCRRMTHPSVMGPLGECIQPFQPQVIHKMFIWSTYPLASLIKWMWEERRRERDVALGTDVSPYDVEFMAMLERALNYGHTGSGKVLSRKLMDRAFMSLGIVHDGFPCINKTYLSFGDLSVRKVSVNAAQWPLNSATMQPLTCSKRAQQLTYDEKHYQVISPSISTMANQHGASAKALRRKRNPSSGTHVGEWDVEHVVLRGNATHGDFRNSARCGVAEISTECISRNSAARRFEEKELVEISAIQHTAELRKSLRNAFPAIRHRTYEAIFTIRHVISYMPKDAFSDIGNEDMRHVCYAFNVAMSVYIKEAKDLVFNKVMEEIERDSESRDARRSEWARKRKDALDVWMGEPKSLSTVSHTVIHLIRAVNPGNGGGLPGNVGLKLVTAKVNGQSSQPLDF